jgi:hypothetical protein
LEQIRNGAKLNVVEEELRKSINDFAERYRS